MSTFEEKVDAAYASLEGKWQDQPSEGGTRYTEVVYALFKQNPDKALNAQGLKDIFAESGVELGAAGSILASLARQDKITRVSTGWYQLATPQE